MASAKYLPTSASRKEAKLKRTSEIIHEAAILFAAEGYARVSLEDIGNAVGVSGPAIYRHFSNKQALLAAVLLEASESLNEGGKKILDETTTPSETLDNLIEFHVDFALQNPEIIRVQDSQMAYLSESDSALIKSLQRSYISVWVETLGKLLSAPPEELRLRTQATFGLLNSTPRAADAKTRNNPRTAEVMISMARAALLAK